MQMCFFMRFIVSWLLKKKLVGNNVEYFCYILFEGCVGVVCMVFGGEIMVRGCRVGKVRTVTSYRTTII